MTEKNFTCYHHYLEQGPLVGEGSWLSLPIQEALKTGALVSVGKHGGVCDDRVPVQKNLFHGQDIGCVGPNDSNCPYPKDAKFIRVNQIKGP